MFDAPIAIASLLGSDDIGKGVHGNALGPVGAGSNFDSAVDEFPAPFLSIMHVSSVNALIKECCQLPVEKKCPF